jgi:hypothetical protein
MSTRDRLSNIITMVLVTLGALLVIGYVVSLFMR